MLVMPTSLYLFISAARLSRYWDSVTSRSGMFSNDWQLSILPVNSPSDVKWSVQPLGATVALLFLAALLAASFRIWMLRFAYCQVYTAGLFGAASSRSALFGRRPSLIRVTSTRGSRTQPPGPASFARARTQSLIS